MKALLLLFLFFSQLYYTTPPPLADTIVFICNGSSAKRYHLNKKCKGLSSCQHRIHQLSLEQAKKKGRTLCGWEKPKS